MARKPNGRGAPVGSGAFYRLMRDWHGYFSAFAFLALIFFSVTGILLNHPSLLRGEAPPLVERSFDLSPDEIAKIKAAPEPPKALVAAAGERFKLSGEFKNGDASGPDIFVRMNGPRGSTEMRGNLETGKAEVTIDRNTFIEVMNHLHRGEQAGKPWRLVIDILALILIAVSLLGYILFFSLRFRLKTALALTAGSLLVLVGLFFAIVP